MIQKWLILNRKTVLTTYFKKRYVLIYVLTQYLKIYNSVSTSINKHEQEIENLCKKNCQKVWNLLKLFHFCLDVGTSLISKVGDPQCRVSFTFFESNFIFFEKKSNQKWYQRSFSKIYSFSEYFWLKNKILYRIRNGLIFHCA